MVPHKTEKLDQMRKNFSGVKEKAGDFVNWKTMQFDERNLEVEAETLENQKGKNQKIVLQTNLYRIL